MFDTLLYNGKIYSMDSSDKIYSAIAIKDGRIEKVYELDNYLLDEAQEKIDLLGGIVLPSFIDSHIHFLPTAVLSQVGFKICELERGKLLPDNLDDVLKKIKAKITENPENEIFLANQYIKASIAEHRLPYRQELDTCSLDKAIIVYNMDGHSCSCSSKALTMLGLPLEGHNGILEGAENEFIQGRIMELVMKGVNISSLYKGFAKTVNQAVSYGIGTFCCHEGFEDSEKDISMTAFKLIAPKMPLNFRLFIQYKDIDRAKVLFRYQKTPRVGGCGSWELDGAVSSNTAAFFKEYINKEGSMGELYYSLEDVTKMMQNAINKQSTVSVHAIGTRAIDTALNAFEAVMDKGNSLNHRIDHFEFPSEDHIEKAIRLNLNITVQPGFSWFDNKYQQAYQKSLSEDIINMQVPLKKLYDAGVNILGSSDGPVQDFNPFMQIQGMVDFPIESQRLNLYEAIKTYTYLPAKALGEENERGSIKPMLVADFMIFNKDIFNVPTSSIYELKPDKVYLNGKEFKPLKGTLTELLCRFLRKPKKL